MDKIHPPSQEPLQAAVQRWNALAQGMYGEIDARITRVHDQLERLRVQLQHAGALNAERVAQQGGSQALARVHALNEQLDDFHIELQTLSAQADRAFGAAGVLLKALSPFLDPGGVATVAQPPMASGAPGEESLKALRDENLALRKQVADAAARARLAAPAQPTGTSSEREQALQREIDTLYAKLTEARDAASELRHHVPKEAQDELVRLRMEVATLREVNDRLMRPAPGGSLQRFERIASLAFDQNGRRKMLGQILLEAGLIKRDQLDIALHEQGSSWRRHIGAILVDLGFTTEESIAQALAAQLALPYVDLTDEVVRPGAWEMVSRHLALHHTCMPISMKEDSLRLAIANPLDLVALDDIRLATNLKVQPVVSTATAIKNAIQRHYPD
jgi:hypothetical protein